MLTFLEVYIMGRTKHLGRLPGLLVCWFIFSWWGLPSSISPTISWFGTPIMPPMRSRWSVHEFFIFYQYFEPEVTDALTMCWRMRCHTIMIAELLRAFASLLVVMGWMISTQERDRRCTLLSLEVFAKQLSERSFPEFEQWRVLKCVRSDRTECRIVRNHIDLIGENMTWW